jgi:hypothetical protein
LVCYDDDVQVKGDVLTSTKFEAFSLPYDDGWYDIDAKYGLPVGEKKDYAPEHRHLWRYQDEAYIDLVVRGGYRWGDGGRRYVVCCYRPYYRFGVHGTTVPRTGGKIDLKQLAKLAGASAAQLDGIIEPGLLAPIKTLVEAAKR